MLLSFVGIPRITTSPIGNVLINGNTQTFTCVSYAYPVHTVMWAFTDALGNTNNLASGSKYSITTIPSGAVMNSTLTIYNIQYQDRGQYNCTASNVVGTVSSEATLTVHGKHLLEVWSAYFIQVKCPNTSSSQTSCDKHIK